jgi:hypothetical protein
MADNSVFARQFAANTQLSGEATFDYMRNDGRYDIGNGEHLFQTQWSQGGTDLIHTYRSNNITAVRLIPGAKSFADCSDGDAYDGSSGSRLIREGQFVLFENTHGSFAAVKVIDVQLSAYGDARDLLQLQFCINPSGAARFD